MNQVEKIISTLIDNIPDAYVQSLEDRLKSPEPLTWPFKGLEPYRSQIATGIDVFQAVEAAVKQLQALTK